MRFLYGTLLTAIGGLLLLYPVLGTSSSGGAPPELTGGPADAGTCQMCHGDFEVDSGSGSVEISGPSVFEPGQMYTFTVTVDNTTEPLGDDPIQGFQLSVQDGEGNHIGELVITDSEHTGTTYGVSEYVTHTSEGRFLDTWQMGWIAPDEASAPESVTVYVAANAADGDGSPGGDHIYTATAVIARKSSSAAPPAVAGAFALTSLFPNPARGTATLELEFERPLQTHVVLHDGLGREIVRVDHGVLGEGGHALPVEVGGLPSGMYFARVVTPAGNLVRAFTVVN